MNPRQIIPFCLTVAALLAGFFGIILSAAGEYVQAAQLIMVSMILDGVDGVAARWLKGTSTFGAELDTFVDYSSFGIAPAVLAYQAVLKEFGTWGLVMAGAIVLSGALRLARFRVIDPHRGQKGYVGLPITVNGGWVTLFVFATQVGAVNGEWFTLSRGPLATFVWATAMVFTLLQVSHVHYHKPTKDPLFLAASGGVIVALFARGPVAVAAALTMCAYGFYMAFLTPFLHRQPGLAEAGDQPDEDREEEEPVRWRRF